VGTFFGATLFEHSDGDISSLDRIGWLNLAGLGATEGEPLHASRRIHRGAAPSIGNRWLRAAVVGHNDRSILLFILLSLPSDLAAIVTWCWRGFSFLKMGAYTASPLLVMAVVGATAGRLADRTIFHVRRPALVRNAFTGGGFALVSSICCCYWSALRKPT
jgi:hypothetical protein